MPDALKTIKGFSRAGLATSRGRIVSRNSGTSERIRALDSQLGQFVFLRLRGMSLPQKTHRSSGNSTRCVSLLRLRNRSRKFMRSTIQIPRIIAIAWQNLHAGV